MYKVKDNAESQLQFGISSVATTLVVKEGQGAKFPEVPFLVVLNKRNSDWEITKSEKVEVSSVNGDQFTISRGYEWTTPSDFSADDFVSLFVLARHIEELQTEVAKKADQIDVQSVAQKTSTLEEKMTTAEGQITQLVEAGTPSYLGITGIVWEKYTMEDTLFLQKTPTFTDSAIAINVGDIDKNKEIHIQRIGSWTVSNQLKLKMKKFWAPTTSVVVEVRKWVKVDVSDKEAYRYGGEVVATTTIAYTQFTTDWKEFTLTLNNQFWSTKGELLDIVVYQQWGIVNSTNYYQIACDSTQYSEAFSYVSVNWSSRVREKLMPYCISDWFAQWLLAKVANVLIVNNTPVLKTDIPSKKVEVSRYNWEVVLASFYADNNTQIRVQFHTPDYRSEYWIKIKKNNKHYWDSYYSRADETISLVKGDVITAVAWNTSGSDISITAKDVKIYDNNPGLNKRGFILNPRWINDIGKNTECTSFWLHTDNSWLGDQVDVSTVLNSATTWSIPLGNAIGFFKIQSKDWKTYKIPVYGD